MVDVISEDKRTTHTGSLCHLSPGCLLSDLTSDLWGLGLKQVSLFLDRILVSIFSLDIYDFNSSLGNDSDILY